jgi:hypothetical protein
MRAKVLAAAASRGGDGAVVYTLFMLLRVLISMADINTLAA